MSKRKGNIDALIRWVGKVGWTEAVKKLSTIPKIKSPERLAGWLKARAKEAGVLSKEHKYGKRKKTKKAFDIKYVVNLVKLEDIFKAIKKNHTAI